jgi:hypothetical protein
MQWPTTNVSSVSTARLPRPEGFPVSTSTLPSFRTDTDARKWVNAAKAELVIDEATARRFERQLDARRRVARILVTTATVTVATAEAAVLIAGIAALVLLAAALPR